MALGALTSKDPTHAEMVEQARAKMRLVEQLMSEAKAISKTDPSPERREFYDQKITWLSVEITVVKTLLATGIPSWPWLHKVINWTRGNWDIINKAFSTFVDIWKRYWNINKLGEGDDGDFFMGIDEAKKAKGREYVNGIQDVVRGVDSQKEAIKSAVLCRH